MDEMTSALFANMNIDWGTMGLNQKLDAMESEMYGVRGDTVDTIYCEQCGEPIELGDPGHWWIIDTSSYPQPVTVPLHDRDCRKEWFLKQTIIRSFHKDNIIAGLS